MTRLIIRALISELCGDYILLLKYNAHICVCDIHVCEKKNNLLEDYKGPHHRALGRNSEKSVTPCFYVKIVGY